MGQHAIDALNLCIEHENEWDSYFNGSMSDSDAFEAGILNASGYANEKQLARVAARNPIPTLSNLENEAAHALSALKIGCTPVEQRADKTVDEPPTCNHCHQHMASRDGRYGKFYYCSCPEQKTVSDRYWQSYKAKYRR